MLRTMLLALTLLASAAWMQAQSQYPQTNPDTGTSTSPTSGGTTVRGCLQGSSGNYALTSDSGTTYHLQGDTSKLSEHVGHEVQITASTLGESTAATPGGKTNPDTSTYGTSASSQTLNVEKVKHISTICSNTGK